MSLERFNQYVASVNERLETFLPEGNGYNERLLKAMRYSLLAGGKRLRPILLLWSAEALGKKIDAVDLNVGCAIECIHTYSLIHDDLPGMDNDDLRRGKPTNHVVFGEAMAILAGDGLLTEAFRAIVEHVADQVLAAALIGELSYGAGYQGMVGGQAQDILSENKRITEENMKWIHAHKTGALIIASCRMGGLLAGANEEQISHLTTYAKNIGLAFQITDDILDVTGNEELIGKPVGSDERSAKSTYPLLYGLEKSKKLAEEAVVCAKEAIRQLPSDITMLNWLADYILARQY